LLCHPLPTQIVHHGNPENIDLPRSSPSTFANNFCVQNTVTPIAAESSSEGNTSSNVEDLNHCMIDGDSPELVDILHAMKMYPRAEFIQEMGCEALWVQSWDDETSSIIGRIGGVDRILDAMMHFPSNSQIQRSACEALQNLALNTYNRTLIVDHGGAALIVQAMMRHLCSLSIQQSGCSALAALATSPELRADILQAGGGLAIVHSLRKFDHEQSICFHACQALQALGFAK
jgi:hypothetical protein